MDPSSKTPGDLNAAIFGNSYADSFLLQQVKDYEEKKAFIESQPISKKKQGTGFDADEADLSAMREQAAWNVINTNLTKQEKERARIVRRAFEKDLSEDTQETQPIDEAVTTPDAEENDSLEKALTGGKEEAEKLEEQTMNLSPEEIERRRRKKRIQEKERNKSQDQEATTKEEAPVEETAPIEETAPTEESPEQAPISEEERSVIETQQRIK